MTARAWVSGSVTSESGSAPLASQPAWHIRSQRHAERARDMVVAQPGKAERAISAGQPHDRTGVAGQIRENASSAAATFSPDSR